LIKQKTTLQLTVQVCFLFYLFLHGRFFKGKVKCGFFFFYSLFQTKPGAFFRFLPITSTLEGTDITVAYNSLQFVFPKKRM